MSHWKRIGYFQSAKFILKKKLLADTNQIRKNLYVKLKSFPERNSHRENLRFRISKCNERLKSNQNRRRFICGINYFAKSRVLKAVLALTHFRDKSGKAINRLLTTGYHWIVTIKVIRQENGDKSYISTLFFDHPLYTYPH